MFAISIDNTPFLPSVSLADEFSRARAIATRTPIKHETVAAWMGIAPTQLSQQLAGNGHVSLLRVMQIACNPDPEAKLFVRALFDGITTALDLGVVDPFAHALANALVALVGTLRMARAELPERHAQERRRA